MNTRSFYSINLNEKHSLSLFVKVLELGSKAHLLLPFDTKIYLKLIFFRITIWRYYNNSDYDITFNNIKLKEHNEP
jgi:hypothetical protein